MPHHEEQQTRRDFVKYTFFKVDPKWRTPLEFNKNAYASQTEYRPSPDRMKAEFASVRTSFPTESAYPATVWWERVGTPTLCCGW